MLSRKKPWQKEKLNSLFRVLRLKYFFSVCSNNPQLHTSPKILTSVCNQNVNVSSCLYLNCRNMWTWMLFLVLIYEISWVGLSFYVGKLQCNFKPIKCNLIAPDIFAYSVTRKAYHLTRVLCFFFSCFPPFCLFFLGTNFDFYLEGSSIKLICIQ